MGGIDAHCTWYKRQVFPSLDIIWQNGVVLVARVSIVHGDMNLDGPNCGIVLGIERDFRLSAMNAPKNPAMHITLSQPSCLHRASVQGPNALEDTLLEFELRVSSLGLLTNGRNPHITEDTIDYQVHVVE